MYCPLRGRLRVPLLQGLEQGRPSRLGVVLLVSRLIARCSSQRISKRGQDDPDDPQAGLHDDPVAGVGQPLIARPTRRPGLQTTSVLQIVEVVDSGETRPGRRRRRGVKRGSRKQHGEPPYRANLGRSFRYHSARRPQTFTGPLRITLANLVIPSGTIGARNHGHRQPGSGWQHLPEG